MKIMTEVDGRKIDFPTRYYSQKLLQKGSIVSVKLEYEENSEEIYVISKYCDGTFNRIGKISSFFKEEYTNKDVLFWDRVHLLTFLKRKNLLCSLKDLNANLISIKKDSNKFNFILEIEI